MSKKHSYEFIKSQFEKEGYTLLSKEYKNAFQKLEYICPNGHKHSIPWHNWQKEYRCPYCAGLAKKTIEEVKEVFEKEGYTLLTKEYKNNTQKLEYICPEGHEYCISWNKWQQGRRCPSCANKIIADKLRSDFNIIKSEFEGEGYTLLTREYKNNRQKLEYICPNGHKHSISWHSWQHGQRCKYCAIKRRIKYYIGKDLEKFILYKKVIHNLSNRVYRKYKQYINPNNLKRNRYFYHLDHIYSVIDGFENNIPIEIVSNPNNLRLIPAKENHIKFSKSYITKMMLYHLAV